MKNIIIFILSTVNILIYSFIGLNYDAFQKVMAYRAYKTTTNKLQISEKTHPTQQKTLIKTNKNIKTLTLKKTKKNTLSKTSSWEGELIIQKLQIRAKIQYHKNSSEEHFQDMLSEGAISLTPFIPPGEKGQMIIIGHSSDYSWNNNPNGALFALLPKLKKGDLIQVTKEGKTFDYIIRYSQITSNDLKSIIQKNSTSNQLILSTCYPIGFFSKRFNIIAEPAQNEK